MKTDNCKLKIGACLAAMLVTGCAMGQTATPIHFSMRECTGLAQNRVITITPMDGPMGFYGTNIVYSAPFTVLPAGGVADTNLVLGNYRFTFAGLPKAMTVFWPADASITNAADSRIQTTALVQVFTLASLTNAAFATNAANAGYATNSGTATIALALTNGAAATNITLYQSGGVGLTLGPVWAAGQGDYFLGMNKTNRHVEVNQNVSADISGNLTALSFIGDGSAVSGVTAANVAAGANATNVTFFSAGGVGITLGPIWPAAQGDYFLVMNKTNRHVEISSSVSVDLVGNLTAQGYLDGSGNPIVTAAPGVPRQLNSADSTTNLMWASGSVSIARGVVLSGDGSGLTNAGVSLGGTNQWTGTNSFGKLVNANSLVVTNTARLATGVAAGQGMAVGAAGLTNLSDTIRLGDPLASPSSVGIAYWDSSLGNWSGQVVRFSDGDMWLVPMAGDMNITCSGFYVSSSDTTTIDGGGVLVHNGGLVLEDKRPVIWKGKTGSVAPVWSSLGTNGVGCWNSNGVMFVSVGSTDGSSVVTSPVVLPVQVTNIVTAILASSQVAQLNANQTWSGSQQLTNQANTVSGNGAGLTNVMLTGATPIASVMPTFSGSFGILGGASAGGGTLSLIQGFTTTGTGGNLNGTFSGNGAGLTAIAAGNVASGTLADARLSANVALLNAANVFTANQTVNAKLTATNLVIVPVSQTQSSTNLVADFSLAGIRTITATNDLYITATNFIAGATLLLDITAGASNRAISCDTNFVWLSTTPTSIAATHIAWVSLTAMTATNTGVRISYVVSP